MRDVVVTIIKNTNAKQTFSPPPAAVNCRATMASHHNGQFEDPSSDSSHHDGRSPLPLIVAPRLQGIGRGAGAHNDGAPQHHHPSHVPYGMNMNSAAAAAGYHHAPPQAHPSSLGGGGYFSHHSAASYNQGLAAAMAAAQQQQQHHPHNVDPHLIMSTSIPRHRHHHNPPPPMYPPYHHRPSPQPEPIVGATIGDTNPALMGRNNNNKRTTPSPRPRQAAAGSSSGSGDWQYHRDYMNSRGGSSSMPLPPKVSRGDDDTASPYARSSNDSSPPAAAAAGTRPLPRDETTSTPAANPANNGSGRNTNPTQRNPRTPFSGERNSSYNDRTRIGEPHSLSSLAAAQASSGVDTATPTSPSNRTVGRTAKLPVFSNGRPELPPPRWYDAYVPLGVEEDKYYLSELQCILRVDFVEAFGTTQVSVYE